MRTAVLLLIYLFSSFSLISQKASHKINYKAVNFRSKPDMRSNRVGVLFLDAQVRLIKETDVRKLSEQDGKKYAWCLIEDIETKIQGYIYGKYISKIVTVANIQSNKKNNMVRSPKFYVLSIGMSDYSPAQKDKGVEATRYSDENAYRFARAYTDAEIFLLRNEEATITAVQQISAELLHQMYDFDVLLIYYSGQAMHNKIHLYDSDLDIDKWLNEMININRTVKKIVFFETSNANIDLYSSSDTASMSELLKMQASHLSLFSSCKPLSHSYESEVFQAGIFTNYISMGLKGFADADMNNMVTYGELVSYVKKHVGRYVDTQYSKAQEPIIAGNQFIDLPLKQL